MTRTHVLPPDLVTSLCAGGDAEEVALLRAGQHSKRLVQLRAILDLVDRTAQDAGRRAGFRDSFRALATVQRAAPAVVADLLSGPQVGAWAAHCLRALTGPPTATPTATPTETPTETPLWTHLAHLGAITVAAASRSGVDVEVRVPVRAGAVTLPTLGRAVLDRPEPWASAACRPGDPVLVDGAPPLRWEPVRRLGQVLLDDVDPYWRCFGLPAGARRADAEVERWQRRLAAAWDILAERHPDRTASLAAAVRCLVPVERADRFGGVSASSADAPGAVALTEPATPERLAATLVHEAQHYRLGAAHDLVPLFGPTPESLCSPWRSDPRPLAGLLHGTYAFLGVAQFWSREWRHHGAGAELLYARTVRQLRAGHAVLTDAADLTPTGAALVAQLGVAIEALPEAGLTEDVRRLADDLVAHHRALWRLRNLEPDPAAVTAFAQHWASGAPLTAPADVSGRVVTPASPGGDSPLFRLATTWLTEPAKVAAAAREPERFARLVPGAEAADLPLLAGDHEAVRRRRLTDIAGGDTREETWASLAVAHGRLAGHGSPLAVAPELVRAALPAVTAVLGRDREPLAELAARHVAGASTSDSMRR